MLRTIKISLELLMCLLLLCACNNDCDTAGDSDCSLHFNIRSCEIELVTRGVEDLDDDGTVSEEESFIDGQKMYRLAVFLLEGNKVVASTILENGDERFSNSNKEAVVSFYNLDYSKTYKLYAVANYGNYGTLTGNLSDVNEGNITGGLNVNASDENICAHNTPYPLTLTKDISLMPGANSVSGELKRTYARLRINVRNQSTINDLYITKLNFPTKFTQRSVDIFTEGGTANVSPTVTSEEAITPFIQNTAIPKVDSEGHVSEKTIFDTYLLESTGGDYSYTLGLKYQGEETEEKYTVASAGLTNANNIEDGAMYIIRNTNGTYLYDNGNNVGAGSSYLTNGELNHNYVWRFKKTTNNRYTIESMGGSGRFMQSSKVDGTKIPLTTNAGSSDYFTAATSGTYIRFQCTSNNSRYYLSVNNSTACGHNGYSNQQRRNFHLYKVTKENEVANVSHEETIPIKIIDKNTGVASQLSHIGRNDFIEILVSVTYNEKTGNVEFEVSDWEKVNGEVTFD